jgi:adenylylsulfate kinase
VTTPNKTILQPFSLWFTGLSSADKTTTAKATAQYLKNHHHITPAIIDGDDLRTGLYKDLGFSNIDRSENIRRISEICCLTNNSGQSVVSARISPFLKDRQLTRETIREQYFIEVYINTSLQVCEDRDPKGLYKKAQKGEIAHFTGIHSTYEPSENPHIVIDTQQQSISESVQHIIQLLYHFNPPYPSNLP